MIYRQNLPIFLGFHGSAICAAFTFDVASEAPRPRGQSGLAGGAKFCDFESIFVDFQSLGGPGGPPQALKSASRAKPPGPAA